jgi:hypothetical protein
LNGLESEYTTKVLNVGNAIIASIKKEMPLPNFMKDSDAMMKGKMKIKHMTNCKGI